MESSVPESWNPGRQTSIHSAPCRFINWNLEGPCSLPDSNLDSGNERYLYGKLIDGILESRVLAMLLCYTLTN
jgi:hypothetical protein